MIACDLIWDHMILIWKFHSHMRIIWFSLIFSYAIVWGKISHSFSYVYNMRKFYLRVIHWKSYQKVNVKKFVWVQKVYFIMYVQKFMTKKTDFNLFRTSLAVLKERHYNLTWEQHILIWFQWGRMRFFSPQVQVQ